MCFQITDFHDENSQGKCQHRKANTERGAADTAGKSATNMCVQ